MFMQVLENHFQESNFPKAFENVSLFPKEETKAEEENVI